MNNGPSLFYLTFFLTFKPDYHLKFSVIRFSQYLSMNFKLLIEKLMNYLFTIVFLVLASHIISCRKIFSFLPKYLRIITSYTRLPAAFWMRIRISEKEATETRFLLNKLKIFFNLVVLKIDLIGNKRSFMAFLSQQFYSCIWKYEHKLNNFLAMIYSHPLENVFLQ